MSDSYITTDKPYLVTMGHAPLPVHVLRPRDLGPMSSPRKLMAYINTHKQGNGKEVHCLDEADAMRTAEAFSIPPGSVWYKRVVMKRGDGVPDKECLWKTGIRA